MRIPITAMDDNPESNGQITPVHSPSSRQDSLPPLLPTPGPSTCIATEGDYSLFQYFVSIYFTKQLLPKASSRFQDVTLHVGRLALHDSPMLQIAAACAALHIHQTTGAPELHKMALSYYGKSMSHLSKELAQGKSLSKDKMDSLGFTMSLLYIFAASSDDCYQDVSYHVAGAQRYIRRRYLDDPQRRREPMRLADQTLLESVLYQTFDLAVKGHTPPGPCADVDFFTATTELLMSGQDTPESPSCAERSPVLGLPLNLYHLAFRIAQLRDESAKQQNPDALRQKAESLLSEMERWEPYTADIAVHSGGNEQLGGDIYNQITLLYIFAASVLLRQVIATTLDDALERNLHEVTEAHLLQAAQLVSSMDKADPSANCYLGTWALQVLSKACRDNGTRTIFKNELLRRHSVMKSGDIRRAISLIDVQC
ncbi:hypothetical protein NQ176_g4508 [Zarea fungicola]|uniref:Uncharacterized protein n=1 Tax=Zarea fungicola TaxID=93591 RepID=A0ACC1NE95_9HYPO|nr:hypothetical protein NQ176_g4508 [Lecanicillium fungicola]